MLLMDKIRHLLGYLKYINMKYYTLPDISDMSNINMLEDAGPINCTGKLPTIEGKLLPETIAEKHLKIGRWPQKKSTLLGTNISPEKFILKMIFLFPRWDMLISWRVVFQPSNFRCEMLVSGRVIG